MDTEQHGPDEESVDLPLTLTQASSLFIILSKGNALLEYEYKDAEGDLKLMLAEVLNDGRWLKDEVAQLIKELDTTEKNIIHKPKWGQS